MSIATSTSFSVVVTMILQANPRPKGLGGLAFEMQPSPDPREDPKSRS